MGGLGRTVNGSYAQFTRVRAENVAPSHVFSFDQIGDAHSVMEAGDAGGKMVVLVD